MSYSDAIDNVTYDVPAEVDTTHHGWKNLTLIFSNLPQDQRSYEKKKNESRLKLMMRPEEENSS